MFLKQRKQGLAPTGLSPGVPFPKILLNWFSSIDHMALASNPFSYLTLTKWLLHLFLMSSLDHLPLFLMSFFPSSYIIDHECVLASQSRINRENAGPMALRSLGYGESTLFSLPKRGGRIHKTWRSQKKRKAQCSFSTSWLMSYKT